MKWVSILGLLIVLPLLSGRGVIQLSDENYTDQHPEAPIVAMVFPPSLITGFNTKQGMTPPPSSRGTK